MVEDINNILNSGDVAGLYKNEDFEGIYMVGKGECIRKNIPLNKMNMFSCYLGRVKQNIHIVLAFSPLGDVFRTRLRMFPSLVNCCTIDWFTEWPEEALMNVAKGIIADGDMNLGSDEDLCVDMFKIMHQSVERKSKKFLDELRRRNYVTPTSYLELLNTYKSVLSERKKFFGDARRRLERGLEVLYEAAIEVANLREMLEKKGPELQKTQIEVANTKLVIEKESVEANEIKVVVSAEEIEAAAQEAEVSKIKGDADADLAVAIPALENAVKKVREINVNDFYELKAVNTPGPSIVACF
jgi:dynein heavy chain, axonemal